MRVRAAVHALATSVPDDVAWAITGSANLALRGLAVEPDDVDVMTDADGARRIAESFSEHVTRPVTPPEADPDRRIRSHFGVLDLDGIEVEVMGAVEHCVDGEWVSTDDVATTREYLDVDGRSVPAMPLDHELRGYRDLGRDERVSLIEAQR